MNPSDASPTVENQVMKPLVVVLLVCALACGCTSLRGQPEPLATRVAYAPAEAATAGAIFQSGRDIAYFEDLKAHRVGDILTIRLQEATQATKSSNTQTKKESDTSLPAPTLAGRPVTVNGTEVLDMSIAGEREFNGQGSSSQSNRLEGSITATVVERLPNGNLVIEGEKWLTLNQGDELIRVSGIVRPYDINPDNTVSSDKIANARIKYSGKGTLADANRAGWLARFFNSPIWPY